MKIRMVEQMGDSMERINSRQRHPTPAPPPVYSPIPALPQPQYQQPQYHQPYPQQLPQQLPQPIATPASLTPISAPPRTAPARSSSPIDTPQEEGNVLDGFFEWKIQWVVKPAWNAQVAEVRRIVEREMWTTEHLKGISDPSSSIYNTEITKGIPDGMARSFKEELRERPMASG